MALVPKLSSALPAWPGGPTVAEIAKHQLTSPSAEAQRRAVAARQLLVLLAR